ncbi:MAG TPA: malonate decarboxylase acyl carrier protein [Chthoniobacteraceae bacterium]|nr:malonate decarboxylase acyl carrier protein [Chthoniobacteraceae bacterium]
MEHLTFSFPSEPFTGDAAAPVMAGVVGSGNLEVLVERGEPGAVKVEVATSAKGFGATWEAVLSDLAAQFAVGGLHFSINDHAATPAVVALRLRQALELFVK